VTVNFATADDSATAGSDYTAKSGMLTFLAGWTSQNVAVIISGDEAVEPDERFWLNLNAATNASLADGQAAGRILNDDQSPGSSGASVQGFRRNAPVSAQLSLGPDLDAGTPDTLARGTARSRIAPQLDRRLLVEWSDPVPVFAPTADSVDRVLTGASDEEPAADWLGEILDELASASRR
jgi:hypothetical protein